MFQLASPVWLVLLLLPLLIYATWRAKSRQNLWGAQLPFASRLRDGGGIAVTEPAGRWRYAILALLWALLVFALSNPLWLGPLAHGQRAGRNIMVALDLSGSMATQDMQYHDQYYTRLAMVKRVAKTFIDQRNQDRIGLILFGSQAYLQTPLTFDHAALQLMLADATVGLAGQRTAIGDAIGLAIKRLLRYPEQSRVLVLLTDGMNNAGSTLPMDAARVAKENRVKIYTIGLAGGKMPMQTIFGTQMVDTRGDLDERTLQQIATLTGGVYFKASSGEDLAKVYRTLDQLESTTHQPQYARPITALFYWPLGLALVISFLWALWVCVRLRRHQEVV